MKILFILICELVSSIFVFDLREENEKKKHNINFIFSTHPAAAKAWRTGYEKQFPFQYTW